MTKTPLHVVSVQNTPLTWKILLSTLLMFVLNIFPRVSLHSLIVCIVVIYGLFTGAFSFWIRSVPYFIPMNFSLWIQPQQQRFGFFSFQFWYIHNNTHTHTAHTTQQTIYLVHFGIPIRNDVIGKWPHTQNLSLLIADKRISSTFQSFRNNQSIDRHWIPLFSQTAMFIAFDWTHRIQQQ